MFIYMYTKKESTRYFLSHTAHIIVTILYNAYINMEYIYLYIFFRNIDIIIVEWENMKDMLINGEKMRL